MPVTFFDLVSFFGVAAFFAWIGFTPLQGQQILNDVTRNRFKAKENLNRINDYFLVSFLFFSITAVSDYIVHDQQLPTQARGFLYLLIGVLFFFGIVSLGAPMWYIRRISREESKDYLVDVDPPPFGPTLGNCSLIAVSAFVAAVGVFLEKHWFLMFEFIVFLALGFVGFYWSMKYWRLQGLKGAGLLLLTLAPVLLFMLLALTHRL